MEMKTERIVVVCICAVLLGNLYAQGLAWACHFSMPSVAQLFWPLPMEMPFGAAGNSARRPSLSDSVTAFVCSGWLPLGIVYSEARLLKRALTEIQTLKAGFNEKSSRAILNLVQHLDAGASNASSLQEK
jgi:hypothetical protein